MDRNDLNQLLEKADRLYQRGNLEDALDAYELLLEQDDSIAWAYSRIGAILAQLGNLEAAEEALHKAIERDPNLPQAYSNLGNIHYSRGEYERALERYKEAAALDPNNPLFHENIHAAYRKMGKVSEAVAALKHAHRLIRAEARDNLKTKINEVKTQAKGRFGCLGTMGVLLLVTSTILLVLF